MHVSRNKVMSTAPRTVAISASSLGHNKVVVERKAEAIRAGYLIQHPRKQR